MPQVVPANMTTERPDKAGDHPSLTETALTLPSGNVWSVAQGAQGYLWFATDGGLAVDVGAEDPLVIGTSVTANGETVPAAVTSVTPAADNGVWIADGHLKYVSLWVDKVVNTQIPADTVIRNGEDLWTVHGATARLIEVTTMKVKRTVSLDFIDVAITPNPITVDVMGSLYIGGQRELVRVTRDGVVVRFDAAGGVAGLTPRRDGGVWISSLTGLWSLDDGDAAAPVLTAPPHPQDTGGLPTAGIVELADGRVLIGLGDGGVGVFDPASSGWVETDNTDLATTTPVERLFQDKAERVWLTTADGRVMRFRDSNPYHAIDLPTFGARGAPTVKSLLHEGGDLWAALGPDGIAKYTESTGQWTKPIVFATDDANTEATPNVSSLAWFNGELWIGTNGQGLYRVSGQGGTAKPVSTGVSDSILDLQATDLGLFFLCQWDDGLHRVDDQGQVHSVPMSLVSPDGTPISETPSPITVTARGDGTLFAADDLGLWRYDAASTSLHLVQHVPGKTDWSAGTSSLFVETADVVWIGSDVGVQRVDVTSGEVREYTVKNGIPSGAVTTLVPHGDGGALWVGTTNGLALIDLDSAQIVSNLGIDQGLKSTQFVDAAGTTARDGRAFVAAADTVVVLPWTRPPDQSAVRFQLRCSEGCDVTPDGDAVVQDPNRLTFEFIAPDSEQARTLPVEYRLVGHNDSWSFTNPDRRYASFSELNPGKYTFEVRSVLGASEREPGASAETYQTARFEVHERWWRRTSTQLGFAALLSAAIFTRVALYVRRRKRLELQLERTVCQRTAELEQSRAAAEHANQAKDRFLRAVTHDLRSPLGSVIGYAELISNTDLDAEQRLYADAIDRAGHNLFDLVEDLLFQSSNIVSSGQRVGEATTLRQIIRQASRFVATHASTESMTIVEHAETDDTVIVDGRGLKHVLINLLSNAVKYSGGSTIDISVMSTGSHTSDGIGTYLFTVTDDGGALAPEVIDRIFDAGFRGAPASVSGIGLGLSMCREWVSLNGGELTASVNPDVATTFSFSLPLPLAQPPEAPEQSTVAGSPITKVATSDGSRGESTGPEHDQGSADQVAQRPAGDAGHKMHPLVLVVDDEALVRGLLTTMLNRLGYRYRVFDNAVDALDSLAGARSELPQIIISDLMMEPMSGEDFARSIRESLQGGAPPIVAITGVPTEAASTGLFDVVIGKPLRSRDLKNVLDEIAPLPVAR